MLQDIRDRATGVFAYVILFLISIPFALWGIQSYFDGGGKSLVAEVNGEEIPTNAYQNAYQQQKQRLDQMFGGQMPEGLVNEDMLKNQAVDSLIVDAVLRQEVDNAGYRISDQALLDAIQGMEVFQNNGRFDPNLYNRLLDRQRMTKTGFEQQMRDSLKQEQFRSGIIMTAATLTAQEQDYYRLVNQRRDFDYATIKAEDFREQAVPDEAAIQAYYDAHLQAYLTDERLRIAYVELNIDDIAASVAVDDDQALQYYDEYRESYRTPERRKLAHILIKVEDQRSEQEAMIKAQEIQAQIEAGKVFADMAEQFSEDAFTAKRGGNLGEVETGEFGGAFDDVAFGLAPGEVSAPVRTERGVELILAESVTPSRQKGFEEVKDRIKDELRRQQAERDYLDLTEKLGTLSYEVPDNLEEAANAVGAQVRNSDWFSAQQGSGIAQNPAIRAAAFSADVLRERNNSDLIETGDGQVVVLRILEHEAAQQRPLSEVSDIITNILDTQGMQRMAREQGQDRLQVLKSGQSWDSVVSVYEVNAMGEAGRRDSGIDPALLNHVFRMSRPESGPVYSGLALSNGDYVLLRLNQVNDGQAMAATDSGLATIEGRREFEASVNALKERAEIRIYSDSL